MNFLKLRNVNTEYHWFSPNAPRLNSYINTDHVYMAYDAYNYWSKLVFMLKGEQRAWIRANYQDDYIGGMETSNKLTNAVSRAINAKPGTGIVDLLSMQEFVDAGVQSISYISLRGESSI